MRCELCAIYNFRNGAIPCIGSRPFTTYPRHVTKPWRGSFKLPGYPDNYQTQQRGGRCAVRADIARLARASRHACADRQQEQVCLPQRFDFIG